MLGYRSELNCSTISSLSRIYRTGRNSPTAWECWDTLAVSTLPVMMIQMPVGLVGADHIEEGLVAEGHIEVSLCLLFLLYHTWPAGDPT